MRFPAVSGKFYPSDPVDLKDSIEACFDHPLASGRPVRTGDERSIRGAIVPHAGYMASGANASNIYRMLKEDGRPEAYVVIGPDHYGMSPFNTVCSDDFMTPFGPCRTDKELCSRLSETIPDIPEAHRYEHSIEVQLPFLQYIDPDARIVPVMMSDQSPKAAMVLADALRKACEGRDVVYIASTDMSHYIPKAEAERLDGLVLDRIRDMDWKGMYREIADNSITMCGYGPTAVMMMLCDNCSPESIKHTDSFDSLGINRDSVVGYATAVLRPRD